MLSNIVQTLEDDILQSCNIFVEGNFTSGHATSIKRRWYRLVGEREKSNIWWGERYAQWEPEPHLWLGRGMIYFTALELADSIKTIKTPRGKVTVLNGFVLYHLDKEDASHFFPDLYNAL